MLVGCKELQSGGTLFRFRVAFERTFRIYAVERRESLIDTRFFRGSERLGGGVCALFLLVDGWIRWHEGELGDLQAPSAFLLPLRDVDRTSAMLARSSGGEPYRAIEIVLLDEARAIERPERVDLGAAAIDAARRFFGAFDAAPEDAVRELLTTLEGAVSSHRGLAGEITPEESPFTEVVWQVFLGLDLLATPFPQFQELVDRSGYSASHYTRQIKEVLATFGFEWGGWREVTNDARLRWAVLLLSNRTLSIAEVARAAGYGSTDALDATFRRARLPSPVVVRDRILAQAIANNR